MYLRKINNSKVSEIPMFGGKMDTRPVRGSELINELYPNIFFLGKKKSGKTTSAFHMLKTKWGKSPMSQSSVRPCIMIIVGRILENG